MIPMRHLNSFPMEDSRKHATWAFLGVVPTLPIGHVLLMYFQEAHQGMRRQLCNGRRQHGAIVPNERIVRSHLRGIKVAFFGFAKKNYGLTNSRNGYKRWGKRTNEMRAALSARRTIPFNRTRTQNTQARTLDDTVTATNGNEEPVAMTMSAFM